MTNPTPKELAEACEAVAEWMGWVSLERDEDGVEHWRQGNTIRFADELLTGNGMLELMEALRGKEIEVVLLAFNDECPTDYEVSFNRAGEMGNLLVVESDTAPAALVLATYQMIKD